MKLMEKQVEDATPLPAFIKYCVRAGSGECGRGVIMGRCERGKNLPA
jgi:hypothetical protein